MARQLRPHCSMERFCPDNSMAPVFGDCVDGGGSSEKERPDPDGEIVEFRQPGRATLNSTRESTMKAKQKEPSEKSTGQSASSIGAR